MRTLKISLCFIYLSVLLSCKHGLAPIDYGHDACMHCRMTIIDNRFAAEILTKKGKTYKFDDMTCLLSFLRENNMQNASTKIFVANYSNPSSPFLDAYTASYIHDEQLNTPMNGNYAAFSSTQNTRIQRSEMNSFLKWSDLK